MKLNCHDIGITDRLVMCSNGQEVVDYFDRLLDDVKESQGDRMTPFQPVALLLLDINMPILGGMEALKIIKSKYQRMNSALDLGDTGRQDGNPLLLRPVICYLSQYSQGTMMQFLTEEEHADCYLEKPLPFNELKSLLRLLNIY